jgi:hypothetical protein
VLHRALARRRAAPDDADTLLDVVQALADLNLVTAARDHLALLPPDRAAALASRISACDDDAIPPELLLEQARSNARVLADRGVDVGPALDAWRSRLSGTTYHRARDGNIFRRRVVPGMPPAWSRFNDDRTAAETVPLSLADPSDPIGRDAKPIILEGLDPPWLFQRVMRLTPPSPAGYQPWVVLLQADPDQFVEGLALADLRRELADPRLTVLVGPDAGTRLLSLLRARIDTVIRATALRLPSTAARTNPTLEQVLTFALREQESDLAALIAQNQRTYSGRDAAWWSARFRSPGAQPLRVLLPTTRFSTFVRHAAHDLAQALRDAGCRAEVLEEPDNFTQLSSNGYARAIRRLEPDLVVLINYERRTVAHAMPAQVPVLAWVQDSMPHLFEGMAGGPLDFVAGCVSAAEMEHRGYAADRVRELPVPACARKFHAGPVDPSRVERFTCDVAYVGHQSRSPEEFHREALAASGDDPVAHRLLESLYVRVCDAAARVLDANLDEELAKAVDGACRLALGEPAEESRRRRLLVGYALPLADRLLRHTALAWVADLATRRGWTFHLYGRGWERHPTLFPFARGEVEHGEDLRAAYARARTHLHISASALAHQRVFECALSGGLPLCRLTLAEIQKWGVYAARSALQRLGHDPAREPYPILDVADHPELVRATRLRQLLRGTPAPAVIDVNAWPLWMRLAIRRPVEREALAAWILGDLTETTFWDRATLEARLERAIADDARRDDLSRGIAERVRRSCTVESLARSIPAWLSEGLARGIDRRRVA